MKLFSRRRPVLDSLQMADPGWPLEREDANMRMWISEEHPIALSLHFFKVPPDIPKILSVPHLARHHRPRLAANGGGIVEIETLWVQKVPAIRAVFKMRQSDGGHTYLNSLTLPFAKYSYVIKVQTAEVSDTGQRESMVMDQLLREGAITREGDALKGWAADPYEPSYAGDVLRTRSDEETYDPAFPQHPLSLGRATLRQAMASIRLTEALQKAAPFNQY